jgi:hypothetical protein
MKQHLNLLHFIVIEFMVNSQENIRASTFHDVLFIIEFKRNIFQLTHFQIQYLYFVFIKLKNVSQNSKLFNNFLEK